MFKLSSLGKHGTFSIFATISIIILTISLVLTNSNALAATILVPEIIDTGTFFRHNDIAVDASDTPYVYNNGTIYKRTTSGWVQQYNITPTTVNGYYPSLFVDQSNIIHTFYHQYTGSGNNYQLYHSECDATLPSGTTCPLAEEIVTSPTSSVGGYAQHNSAVEDNSGNLHLVYGYFSGYWGLFYTERTGGVWSTPTRVHPGTSNEGYMLIDDVSLRLDPDGQTLHVAFNNRSDFQVPYGVYYGTKTPTGTWAVEPVIQDSAALQKLAMAMDDATPIIVYSFRRPDSLYDLRMATRLASGSWTHETLYAGATGGIQNIDAEIINGTLHVIFDHGSGSSDDFRPVYVTKDLPSGTPTSQRVDDSGITQTTFASLAAENSDIHISYSHNTTALYYIKVATQCSTTVTSLADSGSGSLRDAIDCANTIAGANTIDFAVAGTINVLTQLPELNDATGGTTIDGTTAPGYSGSPVITISGPGISSGVDGLSISSSNNQVKALQIDSFQYGVYICSCRSGITASGNVITGNYIGTDGNTAIPNRTGIRIFFNADNNRIGTNGDGVDDVAERNVISGNEQNGVDIWAGPGNQVKGNFIGLDATGAIDLGNSRYGVIVYGDTPSTVIGGITAAERNIISGNNIDGVAILSGATDTVVQGNFIGTDITGTNDLGNSRHGVTIDRTQNNTVGGTTLGAGNVISGNDENGMWINGDTATGNFVQGNLIGTDVTGTIDVGNTYHGIYLETAANNTIGGLIVGARNVISGNNQSGINIRSNATNNKVQGNFIGTDVSGTLSLGNSQSGLTISNADNNIVGGTEPGAGNVISGNTGRGVFIIFSLPGPGDNLIQGNIIGLDATGTNALGNSNSGVYINSSTGNVIGGTSPAARNVISANGSVFGYGIEILGSNTTGTLVQGNYIGTDVSGTNAFGNFSDGVHIGVATNITVGGATPGAGNLISGNGGSGVELIGGSEHLVQGNLIGTDASGTVPLGNALDGVDIANSGNNKIGGLTSGAGNIISANGQGIDIRAGVDSNYNLIQGNYIGTDITGTAALGNETNGIKINDSNNTIGGTTPAERNIIAANGEHGIMFLSSATGNNVQGNYIGTDVTGTAPLSNNGAGVYVSGSVGNVIGGLATGEQNLIAYNVGAGVYVFGSGFQMGIHGNSIFANGDLGIDLYPGGVTTNDSDDIDTGANNLQNFPVVTNATTDGINTTVDGTLNSTSNTDFTLEFFANATCDPANYGEGELFLGSDMVTTDGSGNVSFSIVLPTSASPGYFITATATDPNNNTSEFSACDVPVFETAKLTVTKVVVNNDGGTKVVTDFPLFVDGNSVNSGEQNTFAAGSYTVNETGDLGYAATFGGDCAADGTVTLNPGDLKECTITNDDIAPKLTVTKVVVNNNGGAKVIADFPLFVDASPVSSGVQNTFSAGSYTVSETGDPDYAATFSGDCAADGTISLNPGDEKECIITNDDIAPTITLIKNVVNDNGGTAGEDDFGLSIGGTPVDSGDAILVTANTPIAIDEAGLAGYDFVEIAGDAACPTALGDTVSLGLAENLTCTISNDDIAPTVTLIKNVINDDGGTAGVDDFGLSVAGAPVNSGEFTPVVANSPIVIDEAGLPGYDFVEISGDAGCPTALGDSFTLGLAENLTCTITNDDIAPKLTVTKDVVNNDGGTKVVFDFPLFVDTTSVVSGEENTFSAGSYTVSETGDSGYAATIGGDCASDGSITLNPGDIKSCTITNDDIAPSLTVTKLVVNNDGGTKVIADFSLFVEGNPVTSGVQYTFSTGSYTVSESSDPGYAMMTSGDCASDGTISLHLGDFKECTITNDDIAPTITLIKNVVNDDGGTAGANDFGLSIGGTPVNSGTVTPVLANSPIVIDEAGLAGYEFIDITGDAGCPAALGDSVTLGLAETLTCTITNDDIAPKLTVTKIVVNDDGGALGVDDFPLFVGGVPVISGQQNSFEAGSHMVSETGDLGYVATISGDCDSDGSITLNPGDVKNCTITNDDIAPTDLEGPVTTNVMATPNPVEINTNISLTANVDDTSTGGSNIASAEYSIDGGPYQPMNADDATFDEVNEDVAIDIGPFSDPDVIKICVRGTDIYGNVGDEECIFLAVYDPDGGFVTGGGWIDSPLGAYSSDPLLTGKANFGFVSKYKKGANVPTGQTEFQFQVADLNFHSSIYEWLVVAGPMAKFKGTGTINGTGNYGFMITATDEKLTPSTSVDLFRIKIWDKDNGDLVVYDNQMGYDDDSDAGTEIGGGNIVIHK